MNDEVERMLALLNAGFPPVEELDVAEARELVAARQQPVTNADDVRSAEDVMIDGSLRVRVYRPHGDDAARPVVVFFHGGGFVLCSIESHDGFCRTMSRRLDAVVVSVDYRLAPEAKAPAAALDAFAATTWVAEHADDLGIDPERIVVAGDSAGGNLAAAVALMARDQGGPRLAGQVLLYPVIEPDFENESYRRYGTDHFNTRAAMEHYWRQYLPADGVPEPAAYVVPARADSHRDLAPAVVVTAGRDPLSSEGERYARTLRDAGTPVRHRHYPELFHGFVTMATFGPGISGRELLWSDVAALLGTRPTPTTQESVR